MRAHERCCDLDRSTGVQRGKDEHAAIEAKHFSHKRRQNRRLLKLLFPSVSNIFDIACLLCGENKTNLRFLAHCTDKDKIYLNDLPLKAGKNAVVFSGKASVIHISTCTILFKTQQGRSLREQHATPFQLNFNERIVPPRVCFTHLSRATARPHPHSRC